VSDREALLAAIRQFPDDDAPRLVFADWLDECAPAKPRRKGRDHAAFIRAQIQTGVACFAWKVHSMNSFWWVVRGKCRTPGRGEVVRALLPGLAFVRDFCRFTVRRGFVEVAELSSRDWFENAGSILERNPVQRVQLMTWPMPRELADIEQSQGNPPGWDVPNTLNKRWPGITFDMPRPYSGAEEFDYPPGD
jgi:uncharacterized protein (TIGR02996 family)